ncbi:MAG: redoxin domain-containing protein [Pirellulales bacterium]|nr:redoxin domain-containing protein [Pirellulales bacterium]
MSLRCLRLSLAALLVATLVSSAASSHAAPTVEDALKLAPVQPDVDCDKPTADELKSCKISPEKIGGGTAWVVRGVDGAVLRQFTDSNNDNVVDTWSYYRGGLEVYRDADLNFNGKADQYRWFHTAGSRWGVDKNEDGKIDFWKSISAEEASEEVVAALKAKDAARFQRLLLSKDDIAKLGLSKELAERLTQRLAQAPKTFAALAADAKIAASAAYTDFGGLRPGAVPAGARGSSKDLLVYEDAWAMVLTGDQPQQMQLGSMVNVDGCWKLVDGPALGGGNAIAAGFFYDAEGVAPPQTAQTPAIGEPSEEMQKVLESIQKVDEQLASAADDKKPALNASRADLLEKLAELAKEPQERKQWIMQLADGVSFTVQDGTYPEGVARLAQLEKRLADEKADEDLITHVEFRHMQAAMGQAMMAPEAEHAKLQEDWLKQLQAFVDKHQSSEHVAEALLQLAMASEFAGNAEAAQKSYERIAKDFPKSPHAAKAQGAVRRLTSVGKPLALKGTDVGGAAVDLAQYRGKVVAVHYWSTSGASASDDHERLNDLYNKYGGAKFDVVGISLDYSKDDVLQYLKTTQAPGKQIFEPGGFENRLAIEMGVITSPLIMLVDAKGNVVSADVQLMELEGELKKLLSERVANARSK